MCGRIPDRTHSLHAQIAYGEPVISKPKAAVTDASVRVGAARPWHENHDESGGTDGVTAVRDVVSMLALSPASSDERARARSKWFHLPETMSPSALILARSLECFVPVSPERRTRLRSGLDLCTRL